MRIGLTGGIGSGKSTVAAMLTDAGAALVDTDAIARAIAQPGGAAMPTIEAVFGRSVIAADGSLERSKMRAIVFSDAKAKKQLEAILHPLIGAECERQSEAVSLTHQVVVFDVPLLVESGRWRPIVDRVLVIDASEETQLHRVMARSGWSVDAVRAVIVQQASRAFRRAAADAVIFNEDIPLTELAGQVRGLWRTWTGTGAR